MPPDFLAAGFSPFFAKGGGLLVPFEEPEPERPDFVGLAPLPPPLGAGFFGTAT